MRSLKALYRISLLAAAFVGAGSSQASEITFPVQNPPTNKYMAIDGDAIYHTVHYSNKVKLKVTSGEVFAVTNREIIVARRAITVEIQPQPTSGWSADKDTWTETRDFRQQNTDYSQSNNPVGYLGTNYDLVTFKNDNNQDPPDEEPIYQIEKITPYVRVADLQVDSLNQNPYGGVSGSDGEDAQENPPPGGSATGKVVVCNVAPYTPNSSKPGWADFSAAPPDYPSFATMHLFLQSFPSGTQVKLIYNGNNPAQVMQNPDGSWVKPPGMLRVWTKNVHVARSAANDYIQPNTAYSLEDLQAKHAQVADGHFVFYVEGVRGSTQTADQTVKVQVKTPGSGSWVDLDTVSFTFALLEIQASIHDGEFVINIPDIVSGAPGILDLIFKNRNNGNQVTVRTIPNQSPGQVIIGLDDILVGTQGTPLKPLDNKDKAIFNCVCVRWRVGTLDITSGDENFDVLAVEVLSKRKISNYFSPEWNGMWTGSTLQKGVYPAGQFPGGLHNVNLQTEFLNALDPQNEGLAMDGNTVIRVHTHSAQQGFPQYHYLNGSDHGYIENPDVDQDNAASPDLQLLRDTSVAVRTNADRLKYNDEIYIPEFKVRTVDDSGTLHGNTDQIDVWRGQGDHTIADDVRNYFKPSATCLKVLKQ